MTTYQNVLLCTLIYFYCTYSTLSLEELILLSITYFSIIYFYSTLSLKELILLSITFYYWINLNFIYYVFIHIF